MGALAEKRRPVTGGDIESVPSHPVMLLVVMPDSTPEEQLDVVWAWNVVRGLDIPADIVPCTRSEFEEEKDEIDTLARAAYLRGRRIYERAA